jgi:hypothetical protein
MAQLWYPSKGVTSSRRASYLPDADALGPSWARLTHLPAFTVSHFR